MVPAQPPSVTGVGHRERPRVPRPAGLLHLGVTPAGIPGHGLDRRRPRRPLPAARPALPTTTASRAARASPAFASPAPPRAASSSPTCPQPGPWNCTRASQVPSRDHGRSRCAWRPATAPRITPRLRSRRVAVAATGTGRSRDRRPGSLGHWSRHAPILSAVMGRIHVLWQHWRHGAELDISPVTGLPRLSWWAGPDTDSARAAARRLPHRGQRGAVDVRPGEQPRHHP